MAPPTPLRRRSRSAEDTRALAAALGAALEPLPRGGVVVSLAGDLGAGKTVFAQGLLAGLGVPASTPVVSPTFVFARGYRGRVPVFHVDAYHVRSRSDLEASGFEEMVGDGRVTVVEWGDRIEEALPVDRIDVRIEPGAGGPDEREIEVVPRGSAAARTAARLAAATAPAAS
jgi:tRNA threonylcarbamoyladenosine biosynthesis protein TsaE